MAKPHISPIFTLKHLPSLPHILLKLIRLCQQSDIGMGEISSLIEKEPSLSGKVLRLVNSPHFGILRRIDRIDQAVAYLGIDTIRSVAVSSSIYEAFRRIPEDPYFSLERFWWHCLTCALISRHLAAAIGHPKPEQAFLAGLLHDIGKPVIWINHPRSYRDLLRMYQGRPDQILKGEERYGANHAEIGALLLETWGMEPFLVDAVRYHHRPLEQVRQALQLVQVVYLGNRLAAAGDSEPGPAIRDAEGLFGLSSQKIEELLKKAGDEVQQTADSFGITVSPPEEQPSAATTAASSPRRQLSALVRDIALVSNTLKSLAGCLTRNELIAELRKALRVLLENEPVIIFILDSEHRRMLASYPDGDLASGGQSLVAVRPPPTDSLIAQCLRRCCLVTASDTDCPVLMDRQLLRYLAGEVLVCQPLCARGRALATVVLGLSEERWEAFQQQHRELLALFAQQAALALDTFQVRESQQEKILRERHDAFAHLARQVIHEVNNPLALIKNYLKILEQKLGESDSPHQEIGIIDEEINRIADLLQQLGTLGERKTGALEKVNVNRLLTDLAALLKEPLAVKSGIVLRLELDPQLPVIETDPRALKQVFVNLVKNAGEAMPGGGEIVIRTRSPAPPPPLPVRTTAVAAHDEIEISFADTGPGIPEEIRSVLFEPYVSSKGKDHTGLGLSIVYAIISELNGTITWETETGKGTCFTIRLPIKTKRTNTDHELEV